MQSCRRERQSGICPPNDLISPIFGLGCHFRSDKHFHIRFLLEQFRPKHFITYCLSIITAVMRVAQPCNDTAAFFRCIPSDRWRLVLLDAFQESPRKGETTVLLRSRPCGRLIQTRTDNQTVGKTAYRCCAKVDPGPMQQATIHPPAL